MKITQEMLEMLMGKYIDGEITPAEQRILETELEDNCQARELFNQLQHLNENARQVATKISKVGESADVVFERALQKETKKPFYRLLSGNGWLGFATGLAAGLIIGLTLHFTLPAKSTPQRDQTLSVTAARETDRQTDMQDLIMLESSDDAHNITRNVDWYSFTDENGDQWLVEGLRENAIRLAAYSGDL